MANTNGKSDFRGLQTLEAADSAGQNGKRQLWERMTGESSKSYAAFQKYLALAEKRTLAEVARLSLCSDQNIARWSRRWSWVARVQAFDDAEQEKFREETVRSRVKMRKRQIELGRACQNLAAFGIRELQDRIEQRLPLSFSPEEIKALLQIGADLESRGMGVEAADRFTRINVIVGDYEYPDEKESRLLLEGKKRFQPALLEAAERGDLKPN